MFFDWNITGNSKMKYDIKCICGHYGNQHELDRGAYGKDNDEHKEVFTKCNYCKCPVFIEQIIDGGQNEKT